MDLSFIKPLREQKNLTQKQLAIMVGVSVTSICLYETGKRSPRTNHLEKLIKIFDLEIELKHNRIILKPKTINHE